MPKLPSAKEQLLQAKELGHELSVARRDFDHHPDAPPKFWLECTCGYRSTARRSEKAVLGTLVWHLGKVLGLADAEEAEIRRNGGSVRQDRVS